MSTRAEQITSEVKRLVLKCRQLEADIAKSVPKKVLDETVAKMQQKIDTLDMELKHARSDLENANSTNDRVDALGKQITSQGEQITRQHELIASMSSKFETTVPAAVYEQSNSKIKELEQIVELKNAEYATLQSEKAQLEQRISQMIPFDQFISVQTNLENSVPKGRFDEEIQRIRSETVTKEQYTNVEQRLAELESKLANSVPKAEFEELSHTIASLTENVPAVEADFEVAPTPIVAAN